MTLKRYSFRWWLIIATTTAVVGGGAFLWLDIFGGLSSEARMLWVVGLILSSDLVIALIMEATAPTRVVLGPGDRPTKKAIPTELATVVAGFGQRPSGKVSVRGETWHARHSDYHDTPIAVGTTVRVIDREGLTLLVTPVVEGGAPPAASP